MAATATATKVRELPVEDLILDQDLNLRDRIDDETVARYGETWHRLPPVVVFQVEGRPLLADGFHRYAAAVKLGKTRIPAEVRDGDFADALDFVATANLAHGLPLNRHERRRAVEVKVRLHPEWSDRRLADELGVGRDLVGRVRKALVESGQISAVPGRIGADGKTYPSAGLPKDPNEHRPKGPAIASQDDPRDRGRRENDPAPWEGDDQLGPGKTPQAAVPLPPDFGDLKAMVLSDPVAPSTPTIDEMLQVMARQIAEVTAWTEADGFEAAYRGSSPSARNAFQGAVLRLAQRADALAAH